MAQARYNQTHHRILEAARQAFAENGYDATGVEEICRRAGVSKGAFYHHFPSKQDVFLELLNGWLENLETQILAASRLSRDVPQALLAMSELIPQVLQAGSGQLSIFLDFWAKAGRDPHTWKAATAPFGRYQDLLAGLVRSGVEEGSLKPVDPDLAARALISIAVGVLLQGLVDPASADWGQVSKQSIRWLLAGMENNH
jgi:AcrR family transcriptional regulator